MWEGDIQHAADGCDGGEEVDIVELWHVHVCRWDDGRVLTC